MGPPQARAINKTDPKGVIRLSLTCTNQNKVGVVHGKAVVKKVKEV